MTEPITSESMDTLGDHPDRVRPLRDRTADAGRDGSASRTLHRRRQASNHRWHVCRLTCHTHWRGGEGTSTSTKTPRGFSTNSVVSRCHQDFSSSKRFGLASRQRLVDLTVVFASSSASSFACPTHRLICGWRLPQVNDSGIEACMMPSPQANPGHSTCYMSMSGVNASANVGN